MAVSTLRTVSWRLMPLLGFVYLIAYIDRQNVSFAKLQMAEDLGMSEAVFGLGASLFFIGYFLFELPSNIFLARVGAPRWFARIMVSWGAVTVMLAFTRDATTFYILRFLLGVAEAGLFPGVLYALTLWYPSAHRGRAVGMFMLAQPFANATGATIGGVLLDLDGMGGLRGWEWLFITTGLPAILMAPVVLWLLPRGPEVAPFLTPDQKSWLKEELDRERAAVKNPGSDHALRAAVNPRVLLLGLTFLGYPLAAYGLSYWLPTVVRDMGVGNTANGLLNALLWLLVAVALWLVPRDAARRSHSRWHAVVPPLIGAAALILSVMLAAPPLKFAALILAACAIFAGQPIFWTLPPRFLTGAGAAAGFAVINATGNLGGFVAQAVVPRIATLTGDAFAPMLLLAAGLAVTAAGIFLIERRLPVAAPNGAR
ncbi:MFS transporter [Sphingomonas sp. M1-B02]|uniref:MFS transporter n=1 Tax=Sphingomonas sp. M1-B02 TaxID=3114300 RepID=UPI00223FA2EC|nr:MFS transporter [Sphingomonas sp. S6-11]UZK67683.1 MFS transporter [Sphingomonas sp. S6-11]